MVEKSVSAYLNTSCGAFPLLCTGLLCQLQALLMTVVLISPAQLHGGKRTLKSVHIYKRKTLKEGEKKS